MMNTMLGLRLLRGGSSPYCRKCQRAGAARHEVSPSELRRASDSS